jgi:DNA polymerase V
MIEAGIHPEDILVVDRSEEPKSGKIVIAVINGDLTVKRLKQSRGGVQLLPENPEYSPISITADMDFQVWGVVTFVIHKP